MDEHMFKPLDLVEVDGSDRRSPHLLRLVIRCYRAPHGEAIVDVLRLCGSRRFTVLREQSQYHYALVNGEVSDDD